MNELNYENLRRALDQLPSYDAPNANWDCIDQGLNKEPMPSKLSRSLPGYSPPTSVWNKLNENLDVVRNKRLRIRTIYRWSARAAAAVLLFGAGYVFATYDAGPKETYAYSQEYGATDASFTAADWNDEEDSFQRIMEQLASIDEPELNALRLELEELTAAKKEVEEMLRAYGHDNQIVTQLAEIEIERSRVYRLAIAEL